MIPEEFLQLLRCPITRAPLRAAPQSLVERINDAIASQSIVTRIGQTPEGPLDEGLISEAGDWLYPVYDEVPNLLPDSAIGLEQLAREPSDE